jgi:hypothetical protein
MNKPTGIAFTASLAMLLALSSAHAYEITDAEKQYCRPDYKAYCDAYGLGTEALRACMSRNIKKVSKPCVNALVAAGELTQEEANKLTHKSTHTGKSKH